MPYIYIYTYPIISVWKASLCLIRRWFKVLEFLWTSGTNFYSRHLGQQYEILLNDLASCQHLEEIEFLGSMIFEKKKALTSFNHWVNHWAFSQVFHQIITVQWVQNHWFFSQRTCNAWRNKNCVSPANCGKTRDQASVGAATKIGGP